MSAEHSGVPVTSKRLLTYSALATFRSDSTEFFCLVLNNLVPGSGPPFFLFSLCPPE